MNIAELIAAAGVVLILVGWMAKLTWMFAHQDAKIGDIDSLQSQLYAIDAKITALALVAAQQEVKISTMWAYQMRRAMSEAVEKGIATVNSPLTFSEEAFQRLDPIKPKLHEWWENTGNSLTHADALLNLEKLFGEELFDLVCTPCKLTHGSCLILAFGIARGTRVVDLKL